MPSAFPISIRFRGGLSASQQAVFVAAAARWQKVIVQPLPAVMVGTTKTTGLLIDAQGVKIDGPRGILGQAGPTRLRPGNMGAAAFLPCAGVMSFDSDDLSAMEHDGTILDVITHEMGHVLGIGTVWQRRGRLVGAGLPNPTFNGKNANSEYATLRFPGQVSSVPVENMGGPGTRDAHWRERVFANELMTGYVSRPGVPNPLSRLTVASLEDIGYAIDFHEAEPFALPTSLEVEEMGPPMLRAHAIGTIPFEAGT